MAELTAYERLIFEDGKIRVRHDQADFTRDATPEEVWNIICELQDEITEWEVEYRERDY